MTFTPERTEANPSSKTVLHEDTAHRDTHPLSRRTVLRALGAASTIPLLVGSETRAATGEPWSLVTLPDTQKYAEREGRISYAKAQTQWVVDNLGRENIRFVSHEGDIVENGDREVEWQRMDDVMSTLDGNVPYSVVTGNHDYATLWDRSSSTDLYEQYFGPSRFAGRSWFGGNGPGSDGLSTYQLFSAGGYDFLHLALEWEPPGRVSDRSTTLGWAQGVLDRYPDRPTILTTHSYLQDSPSRRADFVQEADGNGNSGETVWRRLVSKNSQVFMVVNGHFHERSGSAKGEYHQTSTNDAGQNVYEMVANYQNYANGGDSWLRIIRFEPGGGSGESDRIAVRTYSPTRDEYATDSSSQFSFDLDFDARFGSTDDEEVAGDADADGDVDSDDVRLVQRHIAGYDDDIDESAADMDGDGDIDIADAVSIDRERRNE